MPSKMSLLRHLPNCITFMRIVLVVPIVIAIRSEHYQSALILIMIAGISDGLDGFLAKRCGWVTWWGGILDPIADKVLMFAVMVSLGVQGALPIWLVVLIVLRDVMILIGSTVYYFLIEPFIASPLWISKVNTALQLLLVGIVLYSKAIAPVSETGLWIVIGLVVCTTVASGVGYVRVWQRWSHGA